MPQTGDCGLPAKVERSAVVRRSDEEERGMRRAVIRLCCQWAVIAVGAAPARRPARAGIHRAGGSDLRVVRRHARRRRQRPITRTPSDREHLVGQGSLQRLSSGQARVPHSPDECSTQIEESLYEAFAAVPPPRSRCGNDRHMASMTARRSTALSASAAAGSQFDPAHSRSGQGLQANQASQPPHWPRPTESSRDSAFRSAVVIIYEQPCPAMPRPSKPPGCRSRRCRRRTSSDE